MQWGGIELHPSLLPQDAATLDLRSAKKCFAYYLSIFSCRYGPGLLSG